MALTYGPNLGLLVDGDAGELHYSALMKQWRGLDALVQPRVLDRDLAAPPVGPADGDCYIVAAGATGAWATHDLSIARYSSMVVGWEFYTPRSGWKVDVEDEDVTYRYTGAAWAVDAIAPGELGGYGAAGGYLRSSGAAWVRTSGIAAADVTAGALGTGAYSSDTSFTAPTLVGTTRVTSPLFGTVTAVDVVFARNTIAQLTLSSLLATFAGSVVVTTNLTIGSGSLADSSGSVFTKFGTGGADFAEGPFRFTRAASTPTFSLRFAGVAGTVAAPVAPTGVAELGQIKFQGWDTSAYFDGARIVAAASGSWTAGVNRATTVWIENILTGTATLRTAWEVGVDGSHHWYNDQSDARAVYFGESFDLVRNSAANKAVFSLVRTRGVRNAETAVQNGDRLGTLQWSGWNTALYVASDIYSDTIETWSAGVSGSNMAFRVTPAGTAAKVIALTLLSTSADFLAAVTAPTSVTTPILQTTTAIDLVFKRNSVTQLTLSSLSASFAGAITVATNATLTAGNLTLSSGRLIVTESSGILARWQNSAGTVDVRTWDHRISTAGAYELRSVLDNGTTVINAIQVAFATGNVTITGNLATGATGFTMVAGLAAGAAETGIVIRAAAGQNRFFYLSSGSTQRWQIGATSVAESGSNAGSPFVIRALDDAGSVIDTPVTITRAAGGSISLARDVDLASGKVYKVNAVQVVGARITGYTAMTGSPDKATAYATGSVTLPQLAGRVAQIQADLTTHGLIGA